jgi:3-hydroxyisobutyrate dehydrogenase-like beta-hydroxyacid dehydrogenase
MAKGKVAFVGSGMIGSGLAVNCILNGYEGCDADPASGGKGK